MNTSFLDSHTGKSVEQILVQSAQKITELETKIQFLETKNKWLMQQIEQLEILALGSR
jgi:BMFP domain-containing protein YqiC